jgi:hypothetical protein
VMVVAVMEVPQPNQPPQATGWTSRANHASTMVINHPTILLGGWCQYLGQCRRPQWRPCFQARCHVRHWQQCVVP